MLTRHAGKLVWGLRVRLAAGSVFPKGLTLLVSTVWRRTDMSEYKLQFKKNESFAWAIGAILCSLVVIQLFNFIIFL